MFVSVVAAIAEAVAEWQKLKEEGKLGAVEEEEEDIYAEARMADVSCSNIKPVTVITVRVLVSPCSKQRLRGVGMKKAWRELRLERVSCLTSMFPHNKR